MAMPSSASDEQEEFLTTINTTPLVDVMLVLLIIFLITIPAVTASIKVNLPQENQQRHVIEPESIVLTINAHGNVFLGDTQMHNSTDLTQNLQSLANNRPQPEVQVMGDAATTFQAIGRVLNIAKSVGLSKIHFVTEPRGTLAP